MDMFIRKSFLSGMFITIAATVFLMSPNNIIGSFFFSLGLLAILAGGFTLYTGYVGYLSIQNKWWNVLTYFYNSCLVWMGNMLGAIFASVLISASPISKLIEPKLHSLMVFKFEIGWYSLIILGFFCGILMFTAVNTWKYTAQHNISKCIIVILCVMVFITCKFEHCVANMGYTLLYAWHDNSWYAFWQMNRVLIFTTIGNLLGCCFIPYMYPRICSNYIE